MCMCKIVSRVCTWEWNSWKKGNALFNTNAQCQTIFLRKNNFSLEILFATKVVY